MKKNNVRDYATSAYRFYGLHGTSDVYIQRLISDIQKQKTEGIGNPTEAALIHKDRIMQEYLAEIADLEAAEKAMDRMDKDCRKAVQMVYMKDCHVELDKGDIETRVLYAEIHMPASQRQIYRWLSKARIMFATERGLRIEKSWQ